MPKNMRDLTTDIEIAATPQQVWDVLIDIPAWETWNQAIRKSRGKVAVGEKLSITMQTSGGKRGPSYRPVIMEIEPPNYFRWRAKMWGGLMLTNDKVFRLEEIARGTRLLHTELLSGFMVLTSWKVFRDGMPLFLNRMNRSLKEQVEKSL